MRKIHTTVTVMAAALLFSLNVSAQHSEGGGASGVRDFAKEAHDKANGGSSNGGSSAGNNAGNQGGNAGDRSPAVDKDNAAIEVRVKERFDHMTFVERMMFGSNPSLDQKNIHEYYYNQEAAAYYAEGRDKGNKGGGGNSSPSPSPSPAPKAVGSDVDGRH